MTCATRLLRTVDNFQVRAIPIYKGVTFTNIYTQGEEAEVVILSLVRNTGEVTFDGGTVSHGIHPNKGTIGYLKVKSGENIAPILSKTIP